MLSTERKTQLLIKLAQGRPNSHPADQGPTKHNVVSAKEKLLASPKGKVMRAGLLGGVAALPGSGLAAGAAMVAKAVKNRNMPVKGRPAPKAKAKKPPSGVNLSSQGPIRPMLRINKRDSKAFAGLKFGPRAGGKTLRAQRQPARAAFNNMHIPAGRPYNSHGPAR